MLTRDINVASCWIIFDYPQKKCVCDQLKLILQFHVENRMSSITNLIIGMHMVSFLINIMEK